jgi:hypothetical protein
MKYRKEKKKSMMRYLISFLHLYGKNQKAQPSLEDTREKIQSE